MVVQVVQGYGLVLVSSIKTGTVQALGGFVPSNVKNSVNDLICLGLCLTSLQYSWMHYHNKKHNRAVTTSAQTSSFNAYPNIKEVTYMGDRAKDDGGCDGR